MSAEDSASEISVACGIDRTHSSDGCYVVLASNTEDHLGTRHRTGLKGTTTAVEIKRSASIVKRHHLPDWYPQYVLSAFTAARHLTCVHSSHFILSSYRLVESPTQALLSICSLHNETLNIWTHLLASCFWVWLSYQGLSSPDFASAPFSTKVSIVTAYFLCWMMPVCSTFAHTMSCVSEWWWRFCWRVDYFGIFCLWLARAQFEGYWVSFCEPERFALWMVVASITFVVAGYEILAHLRNYLFGPLFVLIHVPLITWLLRGTTSEADALAQQASMIATACGFVGAVFFVGKIPERWFPGMFDVWFASHQIWHVFVAIGPMLCLVAGQYALAHQLEHQAGQDHCNHV